MTTSNPAMANTCAMPPPIYPAPITLMCSICSVISQTTARYVPPPGSAIRRCCWALTASGITLLAASMVLVFSEPATTF
jgi:hypothetical protein